MALTGRTLPGPIPEWAAEKAHLTRMKEQR